ncbi:glycine/betaine ABC transporter substrate-binding protein [Leucobacter weissii]|uniref:Glycine/betaine ABC transporter substrate-binding protein n=1 Tax=Leucobacter weissii TaxID=1983706 RepID=A0A939S4W5_9MICO|nr:glycine betaine ABC transporter substrate-binding protein [Leucobacter weissii]MBO1900699.1 glycine/betaine ABC transporter substrate-binding protein [Leucobacter weissii]
MKTSRKTTALAAAGVGLALALTACGGGSDGDSTNGAAGDGELAGTTITVGSKEFTESHVLGQITALALENAGAEIVDQTGISGSATVREALETGEIDIYWDYTGTAWVNYLGNTTEDLPEDLHAAVAEADAANGIAWLEPANFENAYRIAVKSDFAAEHGLATMSDAAAYGDGAGAETSLCAASEFINRDDGLPGLEEAYGIDFSPLSELDLNLIYTQIGESCNFGEVFSTDARIITNDLTVLEDDQSFFVEYAGLVTLRQETLDEHPIIAEILAPISTALTNEVVTALNGQVDNDGEEPRDVAEAWLQENGFIS